MGLSYRPAASLASRRGPVRQPYAIPVVDFIPQPETKNLATEHKAFYIMFHQYKETTQTEKKYALCRKHLNFLNSQRRYRIQRKLLLLKDTWPILHKFFHLQSRLSFKLIHRIHRESLLCKAENALENQIWERPQPGGYWRLFSTTFHIYSLLSTPLPHWAYLPILLHIFSNYSKKWKYKEEKNGLFFTGFFQGSLLQSLQYMGIVFFPTPGF
jgi:hypothetical protein